MDVIAPLVFVVSVRHHYAVCIFVPEQQAPFVNTWHLYNEKHNVKLKQTNTILTYRCHSSELVVQMSRSANRDAHPN